MENSRQKNKLVGKQVSQKCQWPGKAKHHSRHKLKMYGLREKTDGENEHDEMTGCCTQITGG